MKKLLTILFALMLITTASAATKALFLTGGQSNTDGRLAASTLPSYLQSANNYCLACNQWPYEEARLGKFYAYYPTSGTTGQYSKWAYDAVTYYYIGQALGETFYVAKTSYGGTSIDPSVKNSGGTVNGAPFIDGYGSGYHWSADPTFLAATDIAGKNFVKNETTYTGQSMLLAWIANIDAAIDAIKAAGDTPDIKAIIWHQGESDRNAGGYYENLKAMVKYVRDHLVEKTGEPKYASLPFFCGTIPHASSLYSSAVEKAFFTLEDEDDNFHVIDLRDLTMLSDTKHFDAPSAELFGKRLYNRMIDEGIFTGDKLDVEYAEVDYSDFGTDEYVGATTTWNFDNQSGSFYSGTQIVNSMYFHGGGSTQRRFEYATGQTAQTLTYPDSYVQTATSYVRSNLGSNITESSISDTWNASRSGGNCIGINVLYPGTFTLNVAIEEVEKYVSLWFNGKQVGKATCETVNAIQQITYTATQAGTYYIYANAAYKLWGARYVPTVDRTSQRTVTTDADGYATFGNLSGANLGLPTGLTAWAVAPSEESDQKVEMIQLLGVDKGTAALLQGTPSTEYVLPFAWTAQNYEGENDMTAQQTTGNVEETSGEDFVNYLFANKTFTKADGTTSVAAGNAYLSISNGAAHCAYSTLTFDEPEAEAQTTTAHGFKNEKVIYEATTWNFEGCTLGDVKGVHEKDGMYYRTQPGSSNRSLKSISNSKQVSFEDGTELTPATIAYMNYGPNGGTQITADSTAVNENFCDYFAINALYPGKFSVLISKYSNSTPTGTIYVNGASTAFSEDGTDVVEWSVTTTEAATVLFHPTNPIYVYALRFVPTTDNTALRQATMNAEGYATYTNIALAPLTLPEGLEAYALLPGDIDDDVTKKVSATVIGKGEAVLLKGTACETYTMTIDNTQTSDVDAENLLQPVLAWQKPLANDTETGNAQYILNGDVFTQANGTTKVYQGQAILSVPTANIMANYSTVKLTPVPVDFDFIEVYTLFGSDEVVTQEAIWLTGDMNLPGSDGVVQQMNGLYGRGQGGSVGRSFKNASGNGSATFSDGTAVSWSSYLYVNADYSGGWSLSTSTHANNTTCGDYLAANIAVPGTFYVLFSSKDESGDRTLDLYYKGTKAASATSTGSGDIKEIKYEVAEAGTLLLDCRKTCRVYALRFVPSENKGVYNRVTAIGWGSMSLPYPAVVPDGTCVYYVSDYEDSEETGTLKLTKVDAGGIIPARQGFLFNGVKGLYRFEKSMTPGSWTGNMLVGTADAALTGYDYTNATDNPIYVLAKIDENTVGFKKFTGTTIAQYKAYLQLGTPTTARAFRFEIEGETNAISEDCSVKSEYDATAPVYDLQGRKVNAQPNSEFSILNSQLKNGLYIINGKKIIVK